MLSYHMTRFSQVRQISHAGGAGLVLMAAMLWGTTGTAQAFAPEGAQPEVVGTLRLLIGGVALSQMLDIGVWISTELTVERFFQHVILLRVKGDSSALHNQL